jgi:hypothetical protein
MMDDDALIRRAYEEPAKIALLKEWDPIGVNHFAQAADEYMMPTFPMWFVC